VLLFEQQRDYHFQVFLLIVGTHNHRNRLCLNLGCLTLTKGNDEEQKVYALQGNGNQKDNQQCLQARSKIKAQI
jgi:hypothetical protein